MTEIHLPIDLDRERYRELTKKQANAVKPGDWTSEDRDEFLALQEKFAPIPSPTQAEREALHAQGTAGFIIHDGEAPQPSLTSDQIQTIADRNAVVFGRRR
jgi:hypothetical protein